MRTARSTLKELTPEEAAPIVAKARKAIAQIARWRKEGRCPYCGELGRFIGFSPVCSKHGPYSLKAVGNEAEFDGGDPPKDVE